ncbi:sulfite exporter TauE/SafE family protein [Marinomonas sp. C2222]|uniref:Probable membrane transporter protein n=1 Tax=Marinomonas sargassi TaxID=2984494 RepID=A0ABT2YSC5_9GAMM|nr:sulfite exporter TauE/SafE family protein [Marinomonas sargassi]MCV2402775.1 sulfite exporter TauE/SafE family protein [Marinomonas sargassi]
MTIELTLFLMLIGIVAGVLSKAVNFSPAFIAISAAYFFLPIFNTSLEHALLSVVATSIFSFLPMHIYTWLESMRSKSIDFPMLVQFSPGIALGAIIGAQVLSFMNPIVFKVCFSLLVIIYTYNALLSSNLITHKVRKTSKGFSLLVGMLVGGVSLLAGSCGRVLGDSLFSFLSKDLNNKEATVRGFVVFTSIAALIGFAFPAQGFDTHNLFGFTGAVHLPSALIMGLSFSVAYLLCRRQINDLDKNVLIISCVLFLVFTVFRLWL